MLYVKIQNIGKARVRKKSVIFIYKIILNKLFAL